MSAKTAPLLLLLLTSAVTHAGTLYKCTGQDGQSIYTNFKAENRKCTVLSRDIPSMASAESKPAKPAGTTRTGTPSPADFPKVSADTQRSRDSDRRRIVEQELNNEQKNLDEARRSLATQDPARSPQDLLKSFRDRIALHERNLVELQRELSKLR